MSVDEPMIDDKNSQCDCGRLYDIRPPSTDCKYEPRFCSSRFVKSSNVIDAVNTSQLKLILSKMQMLRSVTYLSSKTSKLHKWRLRLCHACYAEYLQWIIDAAIKFRLHFLRYSFQQPTHAKSSYFLCLVCEGKEGCRRVALSIRLNINV